MPLKTMFVKSLILAFFNGHHHTQYSVCNLRTRFSRFSKYLGAKKKFTLRPLKMTVVGGPDISGLVLHHSDTSGVA